MGQLAKIHPWKERLKIDKFAGRRWKPTRVCIHKVLRFYRRLFGGRHKLAPPPYIQTFVKFCNIAELYLRSLLTYHFQTWHVYEFLGALSSSVNGCSLTAPYLKLKKKKKKLVGSICVEELSTAMLIGDTINQ